MLALSAAGGLRNARTGGAGLRRARLALRDSERWGHPYYWAPYVLIGEGTHGVRFPRLASVRLPIVLAALLLASLAFVVGWCLRTRSTSN